MKTMLQRVCWNSRGWRIPTGNSSDGGFPSDTGYGLEEWNFQIDDQLNGNIFGYSRYTPPQSTVDSASGRFRIGFWTLHPDTRRKLLVGIYDDATLVTEEEAAELYDHFENTGVFARRAEELSEAAKTISTREAMRELRKSVKRRWINWKCPVNRLQIITPYVSVPDVINGKTVGSYFTNPTFIDEAFLTSIRVDKSDATDNDNVPALCEDSYYRESANNLRLIVRRHNTLSNKFCAWLSAKGATRITQEENQVDVSFSTPKGSFLAELKVCYGVGATKGIREAIGQLLEYNLYAGRVRHEYWFIVLDESPSKQDIAYVRRLRRELALPITLGWQCGDGFAFDDAPAIVPS